MAELNRIASTLQKLRLKEVEYAVANIPADWPVTDAELDAVVDFAYARRDAVADRLLQLANAAV